MIKINKNLIEHKEFTNNEFFKLKGIIESNNNELNNKLEIINIMKEEIGDFKKRENELKDENELSIFKMKELEFIFDKLKIEFANLNEKKNKFQRLNKSKIDKIKKLNHKIQNSKSTKIKKENIKLRKKNYQLNKLIKTMNRIHLEQHTTLYTHQIQKDQLLSNKKKNTKNKYEILNKLCNNN